MVNMSEFNIALVIFGTTTLVLGLLTTLIKEKLQLSEPIIAMAVGMIFGPSGLDFLRVDHWGHQEYILEQAARITIAISVMGVALSLPKRYIQGHWRSLMMILGPGMIMMWTVSGLLTYFILGSSFWIAMLVGAIVSPTDPVLAGTIVTGKRAERKIPSRVRNFVLAESGSNDGLAYLLVLLPILVIHKKPAEALDEWIYRVITWEVFGGAVLGILIGLIAGYLLKWAQRQEFTGEASLITITIALALVTLGAVRLIQSDGILAVFTAGLTFDHIVGDRNQAREERIQEAFNRFLTIPSLILFGMVQPWEEWVEIGWPLVFLIISILCLRRLPMIFLLRRKLLPLQTQGDALFIGWFGPIGIAALFYSMLALSKMENGEIWAITSAIITASIVVHGVTATPLTFRYLRKNQ